MTSTTLGYLYAAKRVLQKSTNSPRSRCDTFLQGHERLDSFTAIRVHDAHHRSFTDRRAFVENVLDLTRPHLESRRVDLIRHSIDYVEPAVAVMNPMSPA